MLLYTLNCNGLIYLLKHSSYFRCHWISLYLYFKVSIHDIFIKIFHLCSGLNPWPYTAFRLYAAYISWVSICESHIWPSIASPTLTTTICLSNMLYICIFSKSPWKFTLFIAFYLEFYQILATLDLDIDSGIFSCYFPALFPQSSGCLFQCSKWSTGLNTESL